MNLNEWQETVKKFNDARDWSTKGSVKDLMLNMTEEIGEFWNIIKWVDTDTQQKLIKENMVDAENFVGDQLYLIFKIAYLCGIDSEKSIKDVMDEYEKRFPQKETKGNHGNKLAGGIDLKK